MLLWEPPREIHRRGHNNSRNYQCICEFRQNRILVEREKMPYKRLNRVVPRKRNHHAKAGNNRTYGVFLEFLFNKRTFVFKPLYRILRNEFCFFNHTPEILS